MHAKVVKKNIFNVPLMRNFQFVLVFLTFMYHLFSFVAVFAVFGDTRVYESLTLGGAMMVLKFWKVCGKGVILHLYNINNHEY